MKKKTRIATHIEVHEVWVISEPQPSLVGCPICANQSSAMLAPQELAVLAGVSLRTIFRWIEAEQIHFLEQTDGTVWVCPNSLPQGPPSKALSGVLPSA